MTVELKFDIGNAEYELEAEGYIDEGESGYSDTPDYTDSFIPEVLKINPISLSKVSPIPTDELEFEWDMLFFEAPFSTDQIDKYLTKWKGDCFDKLMEILHDNLPSSFLDKFEEGISDRDLLKRCMLETQNESPSLLVDVTIGKFLTTIRETYFPCGGKKLEEQIISDMDNQAVESLEQDPNPEEDHFF